MKKITTKQIGAQGEQLIVDRLAQQGYSILARNYAKRNGEVDIIAKRNDDICFVEVKARTNPLFDPAELISRSKQQKIIAVAKDFLATHDYSEHEYGCRFDVALVVVEHGESVVSYIENAFTE